jgi:hypothetical protein
VRVFLLGLAARLGKEVENDEGLHGSCKIPYRVKGISGWMGLLGQTGGVFF